MKRPGPTRATLNILEPGGHLPHGLPLLRLGFRPFYLGAAVFATLHIALWAAITLGLLPWSPPLPGVLWHAHEMLFGFAAAVIAGFLLTAGKNWTGRGTPRGLALGLLVALWLLARVLAFTGPPWLFLLADMALLPCIAGVLLRILRQSGNTRNLPIVGILALLSLANLGFHLSSAGALGVAGVSPLAFLHAALGLVVVLETVMGGRVIPGFTMSALPGVKIAPLPWLERTVALCTASGLALWALAPSADGWHHLTGALLVLAAFLQSLRVARWQTWRVRHLPMLWILHAAYGWLVLGLWMLALAQWGWVAPTLAVHALGLGATGGLILGMMTRTARGHTGRTQQASGLEVAAFAAVLLAAALRSLLPWLAPHLQSVAVGLAAALWCFAFGAFVLRYGAWLMQPRVDGSDG